MWNVDTMGAYYGYVQAGNVWEMALPSAQFCCDPKTALKINYLKREVLKL